MKTSALVLAIFLLLVTFVNNSYAEETLNVATRPGALLQKSDPRLGKPILRLDARQERMASRAAALKEKLSRFRDQKKASIAARISENLNKINATRTSEMLRNLDRMSTISAKLSTRLSDVTTDTSAVKSALSATNLAIDTAKSAVNVQSEKDYTVVATSEAKIREDVKIQRDMLRTDLTATHQLVMAARKALIDVIRAAAALGGVNNGQ